MLSLVPTDTGRFPFGKHKGELMEAAAVAVQQLAPEMTFDQARTFAQKAVAWVGQTHNT